MSPRHRAEAAGQADAEQESVDLRFVTQGLSPEEIAAATAVLTAAVREQAQAAAAARAREPARSGWSRSTRALRRPLQGDWRGFTAEGL